MSRDPIGRNIVRRLGPPPRPPRPPHYSDVLKHSITRRLALICADLGCLAISASALWQEGPDTVVAVAEAGSTEADVARLKRLLKEREGER